ncbi:MAG: hypothetical protein H0W76_26915 [Pyrinomonadaceae bacterium]|nr:hypothetical protein [Pyrinomonadaceae bacterium]
MAIKRTRAYGGSKTMVVHWESEHTNKHQDHVIAHVRGATVVGYFHADDALHMLLDIGFVWTVYVDGEMGLLPHALAIGELSISGDDKQALSRDLRLLLEDGEASEESILKTVTPPPVECTIDDVELYAGGDGRWRLLLRGEAANLAIDTSPATGEMLVVAGGG